MGIIESKSLQGQNFRALMGGGQRSLAWGALCVSRDAAASRGASDGAAQAVRWLSHTLSLLFVFCPALPCGLSGRPGLSALPCLALHALGNPVVDCTVITGVLGGCRKRTRKWPGPGGWGWMISGFIILLTVFFHWVLLDRCPTKNL